MPPNDDSHLNNFDLLRLLAAIQVMVGHTMHFMQLRIENPVLAKAYELTDFFPGVPIFFVISGYLIAKSFASRPDDLPRFIRNRALRLYPALWVALLVNLSLMLLLGGFALHYLATPQFFLWFGLEAFFPVGYTPAFMQGYGVGVPNGALWSIPVEIQFYALIPMLYALGKRISPKALDACLIVIAIASISIYCWQTTHFTLLTKIALRTFPPRVWMFIVGIMIFRHSERLRPYLEGKGAWWLLAYIVPLGFMTGPSIVPVICLWTVFLGFTVMSLAFTARSVSSKLLRGTDISYGTYLYHYPMINVMTQLGHSGPGLPAAAVYLLTPALATVSWFVVEKPALRRKKASIHAV